MSMKRSNIIAVIVAAVAVIVIVSVASWLLTKASPMIIQGEVCATGYNASSKIAGRIEKMYVSQGDMVEKGELLYALSTPEIDAKLRQAEAARSAAGAQDRKAMAGARVEQIDAAVAGTVANKDGEFSFKLKEPVRADEEIEVSYLGYHSVKFKVGEKDDKKKKVILMTPYVNQLSEVVIYARDPLKLVEEAIKKIPENYDPNQSLLTGFYRETAQTRKRFINISEAIVRVSKTPYDESVNRDRVQILKGRKIVSQKAGDTLAIKLLGGPNASIYLDVVKNADLLLDKEMLPCYKFTMEESAVIDERPQYVVSFEPQLILPYALYRGKLYIDMERLSFTRAEFALDMSDPAKATQVILRKKPFGLRFKPQEVSYQVNYVERDGKSYLSYVRNLFRFKCDWKRRLFSTGYTVLSEVVITDGRKGTPDDIPRRLAFKQSQCLSDDVTYFTDADFWESYNIIEPDESLEKAVKKLRKGYK